MRVPQKAIWTLNDYVIQYPIDAVHTVKFADLLEAKDRLSVKW